MTTKNHGHLQGSADASYKLRQKLHQTDNAAEVALNRYYVRTDIPAKSSTEPVLKSNDDFWVGDGAGQECHICALDGQGTALGEDVLEMKSTVSKRSLACQQRCEERKKLAWEAAASMQIPVFDTMVDGSKITLDDIVERPPEGHTMTEPVQEEVVKQKDMDLSEVAYPDGVAEIQLEGCTVIEPVQEEVFKHHDMESLEVAHPDMVQKRKANMYYNMRQHCRQKLTMHTNTEIKTTETANFHQSSVVHVITPEELDNLTRTRGLQVLHLSLPT